MKTNWPLVVLFCFVSALSLKALHPPSQLALRVDEFAFQGHIVLFDWVLHELTSGEDVVVRLTDGQSQNAKYVRIIYQRSSPQAPIDPDAPELPWNAFLGKGRPWRFDVYKPRTAQERASCESQPTTVTFDDEHGQAKVSALVQTPGADLGEIPSIESLPCYVLKPKGWKHDTADATPSQVKH